MIDYDNEIKDLFDDLPDSMQEKIMEIVANFHIRNGVKHSDGSMGTIKITNRQMNNCLAYMINSGI